MIITIDGTAGSGKSTAARNLSDCLGIPFLDTGAMYRAVTLNAMKNNVNLECEREMADIAGRTEFQVFPGTKSLVIRAGSENITDEIRSEKVTRNVKHIASSPAVRKILVSIQRRIGKDFGEFVTEGRDQGSVVFPSADYKFYLDAAPEERARRRYEELDARGENPDLDEILGEIVARDREDKNRETGPLVIPEGAVIIDTSGLDIEETRDKLMEYLELDT